MADEYLKLSVKNIKCGRSPFAFLTDYVARIELALHDSTGKSFELFRRDVLKDFNVFEFSRIHDMTGVVTKPRQQHGLGHGANLPDRMAPNRWPKLRLRIC